MNETEKGMIRFVRKINACDEEIAHWERVAEKFMEDGETPNKIAFPVALFHDLVEDEYCTLEQLHGEWNLSDKQIAALDAITRREGEQYFAYIDRVKQNGIARRVKLADLEDNIGRCANDLPKRWGLIHRYAKAYGILIGEWREARND